MSSSAEAGDSNDFRNAVVLINSVYGQVQSNGFNECVTLSSEMFKPTQ
jgi:hypothetical protein